MQHARIKLIIVTCTALVQDHLVLHLEIKMKHFLSYTLGILQVNFQQGHIPEPKEGGLLRIATRSCQQFQITHPNMMDPQHVQDLTLGKKRDRLYVMRYKFTTFTWMVGEYTTKQ